MPYINWVLVALSLLFSAGTALHALLYKRDPRASLGWIAVCLVFPVFGPLLYLLFGINRVRTKAKRLGTLKDGALEAVRLAEDKAASQPLVSDAYQGLQRISDAVTGLPLVQGNRVGVLHNGEQAYPAMLQAIESARRRVFLSTYIFESNRTGRRFIDALAAAAARGADVRIILDSIGELYSLPLAGRLLAKRGLRVARFLPPWRNPLTLALNLRNHRKILVTDTSVAFTGGMNIGDRHLAADKANSSRVVDVHFRFQGPVAAQLEAAFLNDWNFCNGGSEEPGRPAAPAGDAQCRAVMDGPNHEINRLALIIEGAVSAARSRIAIMTPYFLPSRDLIASLNAASLRGVDVAVILPEKNNLPFVKWASRNLLWELLERGVRVYEQPPPFAHSKIFLVDDLYTMVGSANIDNRSMRLNFEFGVEVYDRGLAGELAGHFESVRARSREVTLEEVDSRSLPVRVRDAVCWLFTPYL